MYRYMYIYKWAWDTRNRLREVGGVMVETWAEPQFISCKETSTECGIASGYTAATQNPTPTLFLSAPGVHARGRNHGDSQPSLHCQAHRCYQGEANDAGEL